MSNDNYEWSDLRERTVTRFDGQYPRAEDEAAIIDVFERQPRLVERAIAEVAVQLDRGEIRWAWSVVRSRVQRGATAQREARSRGGEERERQTQKAERWMRNAGMHYDSSSEVVDELFGLTGSLKQWADDDTLVAHIVDMWRLLNPAGDKAERETRELVAATADIAAILEPTRRGGGAGDDPLAA